MPDFETKNKVFLHQSREALFHPQGLEQSFCTDKTKTEIKEQT